MNLMGIMGMLITLLLVTFTSSSANAYHSRHGHHHNQQISYRGSDACMLTNDGRSVCNASYRTSAPRTLDAGRKHNFCHGGDRQRYRFAAGRLSQPLLRMRSAQISRPWGRAVEPRIQLGATASTRSRSTTRTCSRPKWPCHVYRSGSRERTVADPRL